MPRVLNNRFVADWHGREGELGEESTLSLQNKLYWDAFQSGDADNTGVLMGEAAGLIKSVDTPARVIEGMVGEAERLLARGSDLITPRST